MKRIRFLCLWLLLLGTVCCSSTPQEEAPPSPAVEAASKLLKAGQYKEALKSFSKVAYEGQGHYRALVGMALCYAHLGERDRFEVFSLEAAAQSPHLLSSHYRLGIMYVLAAERFRLKLGSFRYAQLGIEYLRRVFAAQPNFHRDLISTLGLGLHLAGDDRGAVTMLDEALKRQPGRVDALHTLLLAHRNLEHKKRVRKLLAPYTKKEKLPPAWRSLWNWAQES